MAKAERHLKQKGSVSIIDALLYVLAGSTMGIITVSFLLWLRF